MTAATLLTLLLSLFVTVCTDTTTTSTTELVTKSATSLSAGQTQHVNIPSMQVPPAVTSGRTSSRTPGRTEDHTSPPAETLVTDHTSTETRVTNHTSTETPVTTTSAALSHQKDGSLVSNPGLVAIICIFCIVLFLTLVVAIVKFTSPFRNNFERLEDVPMGKVDEGSPFAHYSK